MNVYWFEMKRAWKSAAVWTAVLLAVLLVFLAAVYPFYAANRPAVEAVLSGFPPGFAAAFGLDLDEIFSFGGFYDLTFVYLSLLGAIMAASLGLNAFAREKRARCTDFLLTKPLSRGRIFTAKLMAGLTLLAGANVLFLAGFLLLYRGSGPEPAEMGRAALAGAALFFTQIVMLSGSVALAVWARKVRSVSGFAAAIGFGGFLLTALHSILDDDQLLYFTPYKYFDVMLAFTEGRFETRYVVTAAAVTLGLLAAACLRFCRGDVSER